MSRKIIAAGAALVTAAATLLAAPAAEAAGRGTNHVHVTRKHTVVAASTIRPGLARLRNDGSRPIALFRKKHEGVDRLVTYMNAESDKTAKKAFSRFGFVEIITSRADDYVNLSRGNYYLVDVSGEKVKAKGVRALTVRGKTSNAQRPASARVLRLNDHSVITGAGTGPVRPYLRLVNRSSGPWLAAALTIRPDVTEAQISDAVAHPSEKKVSDLIDTEHLSSIAILGFLGAGRDVTVRTSLRAGRYFVTATSPSQGDVFAHPRLLRIG